MGGPDTCPSCGEPGGGRYKAPTGPPVCWQCWSERDEIADQTDTTNSWSAVDLITVVAGIQAGQIIGPVPTLLPRTDGVPLVYRGDIHSISGEPESCKGWIAASGAKPILERGGHVLYVDFEDGAPSIVMRLLALGVSPEAIIQWFTYVRPVDPFDPEAFYQLARARDYELAVIDGLTEAYGLLGLDILSNGDAAKFLSAIPRPIADLGTGVVQLDHLGRNKDARGRFSIGAQHKLAGIAVAYTTEVIKPLSRTNEGLVKLKIEKDRHGHVRGHAEGGQIALARITPEDNGRRVTVSLEPPEVNTGDDGEFRPSVLMEKVSRFIENEPGATSNAIKAGVPGKTDYKDQALRILVREGYIEPRKRGQAHLHYSVRPYSEDDDRSPGPQPVPNRSPRPVEPNRSPGPLPLQRGPDQGTSCPNVETTLDPPPVVADVDDPDADAEFERITAKFGEVVG